MSIEALIFSIISAKAQIDAGEAEKQEADLNAFNIKTDKKLNAVEADQVALSIKRDFDTAMEANIAALSATGRDIGSSMTIKAFLQKQKETAYEDISRTQNQKHWANIKADMASLAEGRRGRNAKTASLFRAAGTLYEGYENFKSTAAPKGTN
tara:strand:- start:460 stop:918 length:459 start_codon:yes stop_codon:yes gene_type:complete